MSRATGVDIITGEGLVAAQQVHEEATLSGPLPLAFCGPRSSTSSSVSSWTGSGAFLPSPHAKLAGPAFLEWLDAQP